MRYHFIVLLLLTANSGCSSFNAFELTTPIPDDGISVAVQRGRPNRLVDSAGRLLGTPNRLALLNDGIDNHDISAETESELIEYMQQNGLNEVLIRVNQYDPVGEWKRLATNHRIRPFWRWTVGSYTMLKYTFLPGRLTGGDWYNPFTDTINLYSDVPEIAISNAAYATDVRARLNPGAYAALKELPFVGLSHETKSTETTLAHFQSLGDDARYQHAREVLIPNYGASWGGQLASFIPYGNVLGRVAGGLSSRLVEGVRQRFTANKEPTTQHR